MTSKFGNFLVAVFPVLLVCVTTIVISSIEIHRTNNTNQNCLELSPAVNYYRTNCTGINSTYLIADNRSYETNSSLGLGQTAPCWISGEIVVFIEPPEYKQRMLFQQCLADLAYAMRAAEQSYIVILCLIIPAMVISVLVIAGLSFRS
jgi:hypothetical protein